MQSPVELQFEFTLKLSKSLAKQLYEQLTQVLYSVKLGLKQVPGLFGYDWMTNCLCHVTVRHVLRLFQAVRHDPSISGVQSAGRVSTLLSPQAHHYHVQRSEGKVQVVGWG